MSIDVSYILKTSLHNQTILEYMYVYMNVVGSIKPLYPASVLRSLWLILQAYTSYVGKCISPYGLTHTYTRSKLGTQP